MEQVLINFSDIDTSGEQEASSKKKRLEKQIRY